MKKINNSGFAHIVALLVVVLVMASVGTYLYIKSNADTVSGTYRIGTYNILGSAHVANGRRVGGTVVARANRATDIIRGASTTAAMDVVGVQEMGDDQYSMFNARLAGYAKFPASPSQRTIYWRNDKFVLSDSGRIGYPAYGSINLQPTRYAIWVRLTDRRTGVTFVVVNHHPVSYNDDKGSDKGGAQKRQRTAEIMRNWIAARKADGFTVFLLGDFNGTNKLRAKDRALTSRAQLAYCILTQGNVMQNTYDMARRQQGYCPINGSSRIDHIYATTPGVSIKTWYVVNNALSQKASDHLPLFVDATISKNIPSASRAKTSSVQTFTATKDSSSDTDSDAPADIHDAPNTATAEDDEAGLAGYIQEAAKSDTN